MKIVSKIKRVLFTEHFYAVAYRRKNQDLGLFRGDNSPFHIIKPTSHYWHADPMIYDHNGKTVLLTEMYDRFTDKGLIGCTIIRDGEAGKPQIVLDEPFHLSFPYAFELNDTIYMLPETSGAHQLRLYKAEGTDNLYSRWTLCAAYDEPDMVDTVMSLRADASEDDGFYLLSCQENPADYQKNRNKLKIFKWKISDIFQSDKGNNNSLKDITEMVFHQDDWSYEIRNGGPIQEVDGRKYRIVQRCSPEAYGIGLCLYEIDKIDDTGYSEHLVSRVDAGDLSFDNFPCSYTVERTHTYSSSSEYEVIDIYVGHVGIGVLPGKIFRTITSRLHH